LRLRAEYSRGLSGDLDQVFGVRLLDSHEEITSQTSLESHSLGTVELDYF